MNNLLKIGIVGGLVFGAFKLFRMKSTSDKFVSSHPGGYSNFSELDDDFVSENNKARKS